MRNSIKRLTRRVTALALAAVLLLSALPAASAISAGFFTTHTDWHFDLSREPNRAMTVEEFIALSTAYSYWVTGTPSGTTPKDRDGNLPAAWAAPYIRSEVQKGTIDPAQLDYDAPATLAFAMEFFLHCKGLYSFDAVNFYSFTGTQGLSAEQQLCLNAAIDYGLFRYTKDMDVSVQLLRRDLESKYLIPAGTMQQVMPARAETQNYPVSMAFFDDCYQNAQKAAEQLQTFKDHADDFNLVSLHSIYLRTPASGSGYVDAFIDHGYQTRDPQLDLIDYCHEQGKKVLGSVIAYYDDSVIRQLNNNPTAQQQTADTLAALVDQYGLDGLNLVVEFNGNTYRACYGQLLQLLAERMHQRGKLFVASIGTYFTQKDEQASIYDYALIARYSDYVMLITYDNHSARAYNAGSGTVGEVSGMKYISRCVRYAKQVIGADKLLLGTASFGVCFNTTKHTAETLTKPEIDALLASTHATVQTSGPSVDDSYFTYTSGGDSYVVYFETPQVLKRRVALAKQYGFAGVANYTLTQQYPEAYDLMGSGLTSLPFRDVACGSWYEAGVCFAYENQLLNGMTATSFGPELSMTRGMLVTVLYRYAGSPAAGTNSFTDVPAGKYYTNAVSWAAANGIVNGVGAGRFQPDGNVTREQMAAILYRFAAKNGMDTSRRADLSGYPDSGAVSGWARQGLQWAVGAGIINGVGSGGSAMLKPQGDATRAQVATILMRFIRNFGA